MATMHEHIKERTELATIYAEDGAYATAATILEELANEVREHANKVGAIFSEGFNKPDEVVSYTGAGGDVTGMKKG